MQIACVISWWVVLEVIGLVTFPLVARVCSGLRDQGYSISKILGLLILTFLVWMLSSLRLLSFGFGSIMVSFAILAVVCLLLGRKHLRPSTWPRRQILISEVVFGVSFIAFLLVMYGKPDIYYGGADFFMDYAFLGSILRGGYFPPPDPWLAGATLPYYYGGHLVVAVLTVVTRVPPSIAFNVAVAMYFALAVCASYGLGYNITGRKLYGALAALFVCVVGFLTGTYQLIGHLLDMDVMGAYHIGSPNIIEWMLNFDFWSAPWLIPHAMAQYPYYLFLAGTLHAFMMSIPFQLMFIALVYAAFRKSATADGATMRDRVLEVAVLGLSLGFLSLVNTWDYPVYMAFVVGAFVLLRIGRSIKEVAARLGGILALSFVLYIPYYLSRSMGGVSGLGVVADRTNLGSFFEALTLFLFLTFSLLFVMRRPELFRHWVVVAITLVILFATILVAIFAGFPLLIVLVPVILLSLYYIFRAETKGRGEFALLLIVMGFSLALFCELLYVDDCYGDPWERFNTVFKFYVPLWVFLGLSSAYAVFHVSSRLKKGAVKAVWTALAVLILVACLVHPVVSTVSATGGRHEGWGLTRGTLDGMAYLKSIQKGDYEALRWMNEEIDGHPVVLEAPGAVFQYVSRVSTFTGLPTIVGWTSWEVMWRGAWDEVANREREADRIYSTLDYGEAVALLDKYEVEYVYVGSLERQKYEDEGLRKFADHPDDFELVYENEEVMLFIVRVSGGTD